MLSSLIYNINFVHKRAEIKSNSWEWRRDQDKDERISRNEKSVKVNKNIWKRKPKVKC